ncbi:MAG: hypothetical protein ACR2MQ_03985 [Gemmatimonadaceae bacterium]
MIYVVGSGPAGVSVAISLLDQGLPVTMLDAGISLEPDRQEVVTRLSQTAVSAWNRSDVELMKEGMAPSSSGVPLKHVYGSDFPYREADAFSPLKRTEVDSAISFGRGGFSNVWGSAVLPYRDHDLAAWPIKVRDLEEHYRAVLRFMPISSVHDDLTELFPLYTDSPQAVSESRQAAALLADLSHKRERLHEQGVTYGRSRVAIDPAPESDRSNCTYCAMCMYGCPHGLIYNSAGTLDTLTRNSNFSYVPGVVVERVEERGADVHIHARDLADRTAREFTADRVYLACGPVSTSRILMMSMNMYDTPVRLLDSQYFLMPLLRYGGVSDLAQEPLHTLAQAFIEITDEAVSMQTVHLQIYTYNEMYDATFRSMLGKLSGLMKIPIAQVVSRMLIVQGFLHSDFSQGMDMVLSRSHGNDPGDLHMTAVAPNEPVATVLRRVTRKLSSNRDAMRAIPIRPMLKVAGAGRGFHSGGSFPMAAEGASGLHSDVLGRPVGFSRVHAVDSTVFSSIPATTITFTVMANAHRIGSLYHAS